jgi:hypothetical protein
MPEKLFGCKMEKSEFICYHQILHRCTLQEMLFCNFGKIFVAAELVKSALGVNNHDRTFAAEIETTGSLYADFSVSCLISKKFAQEFYGFKSVCFSTALFSLWLLVGTNKYMAVVFHRQEIGLANKCAERCITSLRA